MRSGEEIKGVDPNSPDVKCVHGLTAEKFRNNRIEVYCQLCGAMLATRYKPAAKIKGAGRHG